MPLFCNFCHTFQAFLNKEILWTRAEIPYFLCSLCTEKLVGRRTLSLRRPSVMQTEAIRAMCFIYYRWTPSSGETHGSVCITNGRLAMVKHMVLFALQMEA